MSDSDGQKTQTSQAGEPLAGLSGVADEIKQLLSTLAGEMEDSKQAQQRALSQIEARLTRIEGEGPAEQGKAASRVVPWDLDAAEALTKSYEADDPDFVEEPPYRAPRRPAPVQARTQSYAPAPAKSTSAPVEMNGNSDNENAWLGHRITDFTQRVKRSLADMRPQSSLTLLEERIDQFQSRIAVALDDVARRSDVQGLKRIEAHVGDLGGKLGLVHTQLKRMDGIEGQLETVIARLSDERLAKIAGRGAADIQSVARLAAEETHARLGAAGGTAEGGTRYDELRGAIEGAINERQLGERQAITMLETMQQAMIEVLDRIEAIEQAQRPVDNTEPTPDPEAPAYEHLLERVAPPMPRMMSAPIPAQDLRESDIDNGYWSELPADLAIAELSVKGSKPTIEAPHFASLDSAQEEETRGEASETSVVDRMRRDFIADAQRAKLKAAASRNGQRQLEGKKRKPRIAMQLSAWLGAQASSGTGRILGVSPKLIVTALVAAVALNGAFVMHVLHKPAAPAATASLETKDRQSAAATQTEADSSDFDIGAVPQEFPEQDAGSLPQGALIEEAPAPEQSASPAQKPDSGTGLSDRLGAVAAKANLASSFNDAKDGVTAAALPRSGEQAGKASPLDLPPATVGPLSLRLAAANGDPSAEFEVAARLAEGKGTEQDLEQAVRWYQRSAARGFAQAQYRLATHLERGLGTSQDVARARIWYQRAAEKGSVKAMHNLAVLSAGGDQPTPDYATAVRWFAAAAERGLADSQFNLAVLYESGLGVPQSSVQAYKWYKLASKAGDKDATARCDTIKAELSKADITAADEMAKAFSPKAIDALVNDARAAGEDWKKRASTETNG